jgi:hypothetical protein
MITITPPGIARIVRFDIALHRATFEYRTPINCDLQNTKFGYEYPIPVEDQLPPFLVEKRLQHVALIIRKKNPSHDLTLR